MSTTDTNAIDEKKPEGTGETAPDYKGFVKNYLSSIIFTIGFSIFIIGTLGLYTTKVAYADILPSDITLEPFTDEKRFKTYETVIDAMIMRKYPWSSDMQSMKIKFDYENYLKNFESNIIFRFLCFLKDYGTDKQNEDTVTGSFADYLSDVYASTLTQNFAIINSVFKFCYNFCPESLFMLLYGFFWTFLVIIIYVINWIMCLVYHFSYGFSFFRSWTTIKSPEVWYNWFWYCAKIFFWGIALIYLFFILLVVSLCLFPVFSVITGLLSPLSAKYKNVNNDENGTIIDFIKNTFVYKKLFFFIMATLSLISNGSKYLGSSALIGIIIAIIIAYFMGLYNNELPLESKDIKIKTAFSPGVAKETINKRPKREPNCKWKSQKGASVEPKPFLDTASPESIEMTDFKPETGKVQNITSVQPSLEVETPTSNPVTNPVTNAETNQDIRQDAQKTVVAAKEAVKSEMKDAARNPKGVDLWEADANHVTNPVQPVTQIESEESKSEIPNRNRSETQDSIWEGGKTKSKTNRLKKYNIRFA